MCLETCPESQVPWKEKTRLAGHLDSFQKEHQLDRGAEWKSVSVSGLAGIQVQQGSSRALQTHYTYFLLMALTSRWRPQPEDVVLGTRACWAGLQRWTWSSDPRPPPATASSVVAVPAPVSGIQGHCLQFVQASLVRQSCIFLITQCWRKTNDFRVGYCV